ncbi:MAG: hypothetical protein ABIG28_00195 [archaeon]
MGTIDDIRAMQGQGKSEQEIRMELKRRGLSGDNINDAVSRSKIKEAVSSRDGFSGQSAEQQAGLPPGQGQEAQRREQAGEMSQQEEQEMSSMEYSAPVQPQSFEGMQPSVMEKGQADQGYQMQEPQSYEEGYNFGGAYNGYESYQPYQESMSSDVITEISEQVVSEKLSGVQEKLEKAINFKNTAESKLSGLDERLKRIEQIIDRLQLSLLKKVGDYVTDVSDIKREMIETQRSLKKLSFPKRNHANKRHP